MTDKTTELIARAKASIEFAASSATPSQAERIRAGGMSADQTRVVVTDVLEQTVTIKRRSSDGMVWLYAPQGVALDADEAWQVAQAMIADRTIGASDE